VHLVEGIAEGMYKLHVVMGIAWFDCKPANFLVRMLEDGSWEIIPADFGYSRDALTLAIEQGRNKVRTWEVPTTHEHRCSLLPGINCCMWGGGG
jgi:hypothetical protein